MNVPDFEPELPLTYNGNYKTSGLLACRDPFVLHAGKRYYLYRNHGRDGIVCCVSENLENWSDPVYVYRTPENFHGTDDFFWAPECHYHNGYFYIFTSVFSSETNHRNVSVYRADNPLGPFEDIAGGSITPRDRDAIDGTLYIDGDGQPWLVFVHEWTSVPDGNGAMAAAKLSDDFTHLVSEPILLFHARDLPAATDGVTDGPYLYRSDNGNLFMLWSNFCSGDYAVAVAKSSNGRLDGKWIQSEKLLYGRGERPEWVFDGGHPMIFPADNGKFYLSIHSPNWNDGTVFEHLLLLPLGLSDDGFEIL